MTSRKHTAGKQPADKLKTNEEQPTDITELNAEIVKLRSELFRARDELHHLKHARLLGKIIKVREHVGDTVSGANGIKGLPVYVVRKALHQTRVVVAPAIPPATRKSVKQTYRKLRQAYRRAAAPVHITYSDNQKDARRQPLLSVVIPYYNRADTIDDTLASLAQQTYLAFETIIVDDGSTEADSQQKLKDLEKSHPHVHFIYQANQGVAAARNFGIGKAKGKYVICLDSDDMLDPTFIEKAIITFETRPDVAIVSSWMDIFGVVNERFEHNSYHPLGLYKNNMIITAAAFRKQAWEISGGYRSGIGYEDWDFWLSLTEHGFFARQLPETLFHYRSSMQSRYIADKDGHWGNIRTIHSLHPKYKNRVKQLLAKHQGTKQLTRPETTFININQPQSFRQLDDRPNVLITIPWMTFGGAETLIYNFCRELESQFNLSFVTGLSSANEWEYKFKQITSNVYHLANLFDDPAHYLEFLSYYIATRQIDILHSIHNGFTYDMLAELKRRHPNLKVASTVFNDRVAYFDQSVAAQDLIDVFVTDNKAVAAHYQQVLSPERALVTIPNGINCYDDFNPELFEREKQRAELGIAADEVAVFFVGRLSEEKNPDVFLDVARKILSNRSNSAKFFMIGDGPLLPSVEKTIKDLNTDRITYLGYQAEVAPYLSAADVFVLPSSIEGFPLSILEAMAMELVVIASDVGAVADVIESGSDGFVVSAGSAREISSTLQQLLDQPKQLRAIGKKARKTVEANYSNTVLGRQYRKLYRDLES